MNNRGKKMQTNRLFIKPITKEDKVSFVTGISDRSLCAAYGFPDDMDASTAQKIFDHFLSMNSAYSLILINAGTMVGFILDVMPELPEEIASGLPSNGRTLAYSIFPKYQRQGYMEEALRTYIPSVKTDYIHCGHFPENTPSRNLLQKLGFRELSRHQIGSKIIVDEILCPILLR